MTTTPEPAPLVLTGRQIGLAALAIVQLVWLTANLISIAGVHWSVAVACVVLGTFGSCLLLALGSVQIAEENRVRRRQFNLRLILLTFAGLGMLLAGFMGIVRELRIDTSRMSPSEAFWLTFLPLALATVGIPLLLHLLIVLVTLANAFIRLPAVRRWTRRRTSTATAKR